MFDALSFILFVAAFVPYWVAIVRQQTKPSKATWTIWALVDLIVLASMTVNHHENGQIIAAGVGASITAILTIKFGTPGWTKTDKYCLVGALVGIVLWAWLKNPLLGELMSLSVLYLGSYPMFKEAQVNPEQENRLVWILFCLSSLCELIAMQKDTIGAVAEPIVFMTVDLLMAYFILVRPLMRKKS